MAKRDYQPHKTHSAKYRDGDDKSSPNRLLRTFNAMAETANAGHSVNRTKLAEGFDRQWKAHGNRYGIDHVTTAIFDSTEKGKKRILYWHIEAYAHYFRVPSALILLTSRVMAELTPPAKPQKRLPTDAEPKKMIDGLRTALNWLDQHLASGKEMTDADVYEVLCAYRREAGLKNDLEDDS